MSLGGLGARQRRSRLPILLPLLSGLMILTGLLILGYELVNYSQMADNLQSDVMIAGIQVGGLSRSEAQSRWEMIYLEQPIELHYRENVIYLDPRSIGVIINGEAMFARTRQQDTTGQGFWNGFWRYLWNQQEPAISVPLNAEVPEGQVRHALEDISARYDAVNRPGSVNFDFATLTFSDGSGGASLDIESALPLVMQVFLEPEPAKRVVELPTVAIQGEAVNITDLRQAIIGYMETHGFLYDGATTIGSVFVMDLNTGEEMSILGDVAHSGVSTIKVGIITNYFRHQITPPGSDDAYLLGSAVLCSSNSAANLLMQLTAGGDMLEGMRNATNTMHAMGAVHSLIISPLYVGPDGVYPVIQKPSTYVPGNANYNAYPDALNQTTAEDMGTMLQMIYDCAMYNGGLRAMFPDDITQTECQQILELMSGVRFSRFSELGTPEGTRISHKVGYGAETVADVAIVYSPATDYIFVMYIWEQDLDHNNLTGLDKWALIDDVSRIVYNYFNPAEPLLETREPDNPLGGAACVLPGYPPYEINLNDISENRLDEFGNPVASACYDWPHCRPFDNWGRDG